MQTVEQRFQYQKLELIAPKPSFKARVGAMLSALPELILGLGTTSQEPQISQRRDRAGQLQWRVYDPMSGQSSQFSSENDVRIWLENRYR